MSHPRLDCGCAQDPACLWAALQSIVLVFPVGGGHACYEAPGMGAGGLVELWRGS